jgi:hypothetical protein
MRHNIRATHTVLVCATTYAPLIDPVTRYVAKELRLPRYSKEAYPRYGCGSIRRQLGKGRVGIAMMVMYCMRTKELIEIYDRDEPDAGMEYSILKALCTLHSHYALTLYTYTTDTILIHYRHYTHTLCSYTILILKALHTGLKRRTEQWQTEMTKVIGPQGNKVLY